MKFADFVFILVIGILFIPFIISDNLFKWYINFNWKHPILLSYIKFFVLGTLGEMLGLRIKEGTYNKEGFGLLPRAIVWGFLGISVLFAFKIFAVGVPVLIEQLGIKNAVASMQQEFSATRLFTAFSISLLLNVFYAPVLMTFHKITDTHIITNGGTLIGLLKPIKIGHIISKLNWEVQWNFVYKKTIPFFWIPAQTLNFCLPEQYRILVAAIYGIILGVLLAIASLKSI